MAKIHPSDVWARYRAAEAELLPGQRAEFETLRRLQTELPDSLHIFYSVDWALLDGRRLHSREVDFVVANKQGQCIIVEQKMGRLDEGRGGLAKDYGGQRKSVVEQLLASLNGLKGNFKRANPEAPALAVGYLLYCPNHRVIDKNAAGLDPDCILDAAGKDRLARTLKSRLVNRQSDWSAQGKRLDAFLKRTFRLAPDIGSSAGLQETRFTQLTEGVIDLLAKLEAEPLRLYLSGVAGCGKSLIARHYYCDALARGQRPLLVCYNSQLRDQFRALLPDGGTLDTFSGLLRATAARAGIAFDPAGADPQRWQHLREAVNAAAGPQEATYDRLIVDEGQDLTQEAFETLRLFLREGADVVWMEDGDQDLGQRAADGGPFDAAGFWRLRLDKNYRSPLRIAEFMQRTLPFDFTPANGLPGYRPQVTAWRDAAEQQDAVEAAIARLLAAGLGADDIAVVTAKGLQASPLYGQARLAGQAVRRFTGAYEGDRPLFSEGKLLFDSVRRYKGLQAPAVLLTDVAPEDGRPVDLRALYCGMSRATVRLEIFAKADNAFNRQTLL